MAAAVGGSRVRSGARLGFAAGAGATGRWLAGEPWRRPGRNAGGSGAGRPSGPDRARRFTAGHQTRTAAGTIRRRHTMALLVRRPRKSRSGRFSTFGATGARKRGGGAFGGGALGRGGSAPFL